MLISRSRRLSIVSFIVLVLLVAGPPRGASAARRLASAPMPQTLKVDPDLLPKIEQLIKVSPTFRAQCVRLDREEKLVVMLRLNPTLPSGLFRARSTMRRYSSGLLIVTVEVAPGSQQAEWIGHEFEHVLEMIEGQNLPAMARRQAPGVWRSMEGMYETQRATAAGREVLYETKLIEVSDKFVE